ncbi:TniQ family protein [Peribacillus acanthi]|uniref:TniQ family protein n=1 Tax=Peribacillus acanthi TaxID=2171554 RepID=UPI000D3E96F5|nr:TniQ family protein [Peribacillus acanthi]
MIPVNYVDFDLDEINVPPRSKLYNLEPIGMGTPYVESLTSYISRLAECHSMNLTTLVCKTFIPFIKTESRKNSFMNGSIGPKTKYINGNSSISLEYVSALEELTTRNDLIFLTMNSWSGLFSNNVIGESRKWCPNCLDEAKNNGSEIYEPLIWYIKGINICDKHQVLLEDSCLICGKKLNFLHANFIVGHCQYCLNWLGYKSQTTNVDNLKYQQFLLDTFKTLIAKGQNLNTNPTKQRIGYILKKIMDVNNFRSINEFGNFLGLHPTLMQQWISNKSKPSIDCIFKIYNQINLSIYELIANSLKDDLNLEIKDIKKTVINRKRVFNLNEMEKEFREEIKNNYYKSLKKLCEAKSFNIMTAKKYFPELCEEINKNNLKNKKELEKQKKEAIKRNLLVALDMEPPVSLYQFSKDFGISEAIAKYYCPELSKKLIDQRRSYVKKLNTNKSENIKKELKEVILDLHKNGIYPSDKALRKKLSNPNYLLDPEIRKVWKGELALLGYK